MSQSASPRVHSLEPSASATTTAQIYPIDPTVADPATTYTARPTNSPQSMNTKDAYYFSHDSNARNDGKILELRSAFGWEGYGLFWALIEAMRDSEGYRLKRSLLGMLATTFGISRAKLTRLVDHATVSGLFDSNETHVWSPSLLRRMEIWEGTKAALSAAGKRGADRRWNSDNGEGGRDSTIPPPTDDDHPNSHPNGHPINPVNSPANATAIAEEKRILEKSNRDTEKEKSAGARDDEVNPYDPQARPPTVEQVIEHGAANAKDRATCVAFFDHYNAQGWVRGNGMAIRDWPGLLRLWSVKDASKKTKTNAKPTSDERARARTNATVDRFERLERKYGTNGDGRSAAPARDDDIDGRTAVDPAG